LQRSTVEPRREEVYSFVIIDIKQFRMPKAKDTKVWNEDLVMAFGARAEQALSQGKTTHIFWRQAAATIQEVRKDIYRASTGR
jgi:hypothetical protein